jgi:hypothetical protein
MVASWIGDHVSHKASPVRRTISRFCQGSNAVNVHFLPVIASYPVDSFDNGSYSLRNIILSSRELIHLVDGRTGIRLVVWEEAEHSSLD